MTMPLQKPGKSKQNYGTPPEFLSAVKKRLNIPDFDIDLAASKENRVCEYYYDEGMNSLNQTWNTGDGWAWCNPPFADIYPWVEKAWIESRKGVSLAMLVPLSMAHWWVDWVDDHAHVLLCQGRLTFVGETKPYPKDCALLLYSRAVIGGYEVWNWRRENEPF